MKKIIFAAVAAALIVGAGWATIAKAGTNCTTTCYNVGNQRVCNTNCY